MTKSRPARGLAQWIVLIALVAWLATGAVRNFPNQLGMDLYHPWGVQLARETVPGIGDPYLETRRYGEIAAAEAAKARETSPKLYTTAAEWKARSPAMFEPTATPFYYAAMSWLPRDYDTAHLIYVLLQYAAFAGSVFWLARMGGAGPVAAAAIAVAVEATFSGFLQDIKFGNVNSLQLAFLTAMIAGCRAGLLARSRWFDRAFLPLMALFFVFKPNLPLVVLALAVHYAMVRGMRPTLVHGALAIAAAGSAIAIGDLYFHTWHAWSDWVAYGRGANGGTLLYSVDRGNQSLPMLMAEKSSSYGPFANSLMLMAAFALAIFVAATAAGKRGDLGAAVIKRIVVDPWFAASVAIVATCGTAPLFWHHYYVTLMIPAVFLFRAGEPWSVRAWVAVSYFVLAVPALQLLANLRLFGLAYTLTFFAWVPMVPAVLMEVARERHRMEVA